MSELAEIVSELKAESKKISDLADSIKEMFSEAADGAETKPEPAASKKAAEALKPEVEVSKAAAKPEHEKPMTLPEIRAILAAKSRAGFTAEVKELLKSHGADRLSEIDPKEYPALAKEAEVLDAD